MAKHSKITKARAVEMCADLQYAGRNRKDILQHFTTLGKFSPSTIDKWCKEARPITDARLKEDNAIRDRANAIAIEEAAKSLNISKERVIGRLMQVAFGDIRNVFTVNGGLKQVDQWDDETAGMVAGIESFDEKSRDGSELFGTSRKVKTLSPLEAITILNKMLGYNMPDKAEFTGKDGTPLQSTPSLIINQVTSPAEILENEPE